MNLARELKQGDTWSLEFGDVVDRNGISVTVLAGWTARFTLRGRQSGVFALQAAGTVAGSKFVWEVAKVITASITPGVYIADVEVTDPSGRTATPLSGLVTITADNSP